MAYEKREINGEKRNIWLKIQRNRRRENEAGENMAYNIGESVNQRWRKSNEKSK